MLQFFKMNKFKEWRFLLDNHLIDFYNCFYKFNEIELDSDK